MNNEEIGALKKACESLSQHLSLTQEYISIFQQKYGDFGERLPRVVEALDKADGYLDDAKAELEVI
jgi:hypothetical protein